METPDQRPPSTPAPSGDSDLEDLEDLEELEDLEDLEARAEEARTVADSIYKLAREREELESAGYRPIGTPAAWSGYYADPEGFQLAHADAWGELERAKARAQALQLAPTLQEARAAWQALYSARADILRGSTRGAERERLDALSGYMRKLAVWERLLGGDAGTAPGDAGTAPGDAGTAPGDAGTAPVDAPAPMSVESKASGAAACWAPPDEEPAQAEERGSGPFYLDLRPMLGTPCRTRFESREDAESWARRIGRPDLLRRIGEDAPPAGE